MIRSILIVCVFCILVVFRGTIIASLLGAAGDFIAGPLGITEEASASLALALVQFGLDSISALVAIVGLWGAYVQLKLITTESSRRRREEVLFDDFPDPNFRAYLRSRHRELFRDDPRVPPLGFTAEELIQITRIEVTEYPIASLEGVGVFAQLQELICKGAPIESLNVMGLKELTRLSATNCRNLVEVNCSECESLSKLDLTDSPVRFLNCSGTSVDPRYIESLGTLETLVFRGVFRNVDKDSRMGMLPVSTLDLSRMHGLRSLDCSGNAIFKLTIPDGIEELDASSNPLIDPRKGGPLAGRRIRLPRPPENLEIAPESATPTNLPYDSLKSGIERAVELRHEDREQEAFDLLIYLWAVVRDSGALDNLSIVTQDDVERMVLLLNVIVEFGATCTQRSLRLNDWRWHGVDISLAEDVRRRADLIIAEREDTNLDLSGILEQKMRATNSLGLAYQRPFPALHNAEKGMLMSREAYGYFIKEGQKAIARYKLSHNEKDSRRVFDAIRYCSNYPTALDNSGKDKTEDADSRPILTKLLGAIDQTGSSKTHKLRGPWALALRFIRRREYLNARDDLREALRVRKELQDKLIIPMFTRDCARYYRAEWLQAGTLQNLMKAGVRGAARESESRYKKTIEGLRGLEERANGRNAVEQGQIRTARLGAQYGLSWLYINTKRYREACELARSTYEERAEFLGADHVDTLKALGMLEKAEDGMRRSHPGIPLLRRLRNTLYRTR